jgi:outer membrane protein OmpA-like peptidoglycan-associated protein
MKNFRRLSATLAICAFLATSAWAQESAAVRPASSTAVGDTGIWYVPIGETLPKGKFSFGASTVNLDRSEAYSDIADFSGLFAFGATDRLELFGGLSFQRRIDGDRVPLLGAGQPMDYPINKSWSTGVGDLNIGAKLNLVSQQRSHNVAFAIRAGIKVPTADADKGLGTGKVDFLVDGVVSREANEKIDVAGYLGFKVRSDPDNYTLSNGLRWGVGFGFPSRGRVQVFGEATGEKYFDNTVTFSGARTGVLAGLPASWNVESPADLMIGVQYRAPNGFYMGAGLGYGLNTVSRGSQTGVAFEEGSGDRLGFQVRLGYHFGAPNPSYTGGAGGAGAGAAGAGAGAAAGAGKPGGTTGAGTPGAAAPGAGAAAGAGGGNRAPTVRAQCEPCTVETGRQLTSTADAQDADGDTLNYRWTSPTGNFASATARQTQWTAPTQPGSVPLTVTVDDGRGGTASANVTVQVVQTAARRDMTFEDVHFDFDRYSLRAEATRILDEAVKNLIADRTLRITIEGHTCNIGTAEYNLALGERRANAVRDYLTSRGVTADRLQTVSYGEERPKHDNSREETRRLNRRAALTVRVQ